MQREREKISHFPVEFLLLGGIPLDQVSQREFTNITSNSDRSSFMLLFEYHSWNLFPNEVACSACVQCINKCHMVRMTKGAGKRGNFFSFCGSGCSQVNFGEFYLGIFGKIGTSLI